MDNMTAKVSCFARAFHYKQNKECIFSDDVAEALLGGEYDQIASSMKGGIAFFMPNFKGTEEEGLRLIVDRQLSPSVLGRSAFCEAELERVAADGVSQYVIFAAGYDTYALRHQRIKTFELDLEQVLEDKTIRIKEAGLQSSAVSVPCDLSDGGWAEALKEKGFSSCEKSFGSLLGISYYLEKKEFESLLNGIKQNFAQGSLICFDYPQADESEESRTNKELARGAGESMKAVYQDEEIEQLLENCGFKICMNIDCQDMTARYFAEYNRHNPENRMEAPQGVKYALAQIL